MLDTSLKNQIQQAYSSFLEAKGLRPRFGQRLMIAEIAKVFGSIVSDDKGQRSGHPAILAIEAGTGTGKTVAYSIAAIPCAQFKEKQLIISTATITLQEQIIYKDLPDIAKNTSLKFSYALAKGRGRYLCLNKLDRLLQADQFVTESLFGETTETSIKQSSLKLFKNMLDKLAGGQWQGDRDTWQEEISDQEWQMLATEHGQCTNRLCTNFSQCPFFKARQQLEDVDIIVTNHDMVLADLALGGGVVLPPPQRSLYIFDEGHHLPDKAINHFAHFTRLQNTYDWLEQINKTLVKLIKQYAPYSEFGKILEKIPEMIVSLKEKLYFMLTACKELFSKINHLTAEHEIPTFRFEHGIIPDNLIDIAIELKKGFAALVDCLSRLTEQLKQNIEGKITINIPSYLAEDLYPAFSALHNRAEKNWQLWQVFTLTDKEDKPPYARWLTLSNQTNYLDIEVSASPILAADTLRQTLWNTAYGAVLTSATLTALGKFDRLIMRTGLPDTTITSVVPSPFQYAEVGILQIPNLSTDPNNAKAHTQDIIDILPKLTNNFKGCLVLFSSRKQMLDVFNGLSSSYQNSILLQNYLSKQELIKQHKIKIDQGKTSILFGLASLAEGLDLPGQYCEHVIIAKIPFAVPNDPIEASLAEWIEQRGGNAFMEITVPDASLRLIQACGRLIRTEQDKGIITLLDRRIINKSYGKALLNALPPFKRHIH